MTRRYGRCPRGERLICPVPWGHWKTTTFVAALRVGEHDFPVRLLPPSRLVGREAEVAALEAAFEDALAGRCRGVLVGGAPGGGEDGVGR